YRLLAIAKYQDRYVIPTGAGSDAHRLDALATGCSLDGDGGPGMTAFDTMVDKTMIAKGDLNPGQLKTVWKSETIAGSVFAANDSLGGEAIGKLKTLFADKVNVPNLEAEGSCQGDACRITDERAWGFV
ncbi:hypothetical protein RM705_36750, partial [Streptomyces sp. DSM 41636]|nr:hypothetical protein [Streptomyces sp. DSM 41636]